MTSSLSVTSLDHFRGLTGRSDVEGLVAVVTGGNAGLGLYAAQALALNGAKVYILGRRDDVLQRAASSLNGVNSVQGTLIPVQADVTSKESLKEAVGAIESQQGERGIDILLCNAGTPRLEGVSRAGTAADELLSTFYALTRRCFREDDGAVIRLDAILCRLCSLYALAVFSPT
ncbi:NAD(P)-binding protein [Ceraceosorus guamensis]|uniref:NAD(P)-binding protein n=1 Tax=Ceraceosorus guamensis TaxID=1522189 RepID=A0A316W182_9BASI|nr:NAD(P)-binding protein [Ceraceosorus guamensis]PWN43570.1 NAD(P)-binding protein [Ceraceosorus guamensis]